MNGVDGADGDSPPEKSAQNGSNPAISVTPDRPRTSESGASHEKGVAGATQPGMLGDKGADDGKAMGEENGDDTRPNETANAPEKNSSEKIGVTSVVTPTAYRWTIAQIATLIVILIAYGIHARSYWFVTDDAFISFRYAQHWADGFGLVWNIGEKPPVEGYSNFLWVAVAAMVRFVHLDMVEWIPRLSWLCGAVIIGRVYRLFLVDMRASWAVASLAALTLALYPPFALWASSGLEAMPFALALYMAAEGLWFRENVAASTRQVAILTGLSLLSLSLVRTEGLAWCGVLLVVGFILERIHGRWGKTRLGLPALILGAGYLVYFLARFVYFGELLSNTARAKSGMTVATLTRGRNYVIVYALTFIAPMIVLALAPLLWRSSRRWLAAASVLVMVAFASYATAVSGDFMAMGRLLAPTFAFQAILLAFLVEKLGKFAASERVVNAPVSEVSAPLANAPIPWIRRVFAFSLASAAIAVAMLPGWEKPIVSESTRAKFHYRLMEHELHSEIWMWGLQNSNHLRYMRIGLALAEYAQPGDSTVGDALGNLGYYSGIVVYDEYGLCDREVARLPVPVKLSSPGHDRHVGDLFFLPRKPTLLRYRVLKRGDVSKALDKIVEDAKRDKLDKNYAPDFMALTNPLLAPDSYLVVLRRYESPEQVADAWKSFEERRQTVK